MLKLFYGTIWHYVMQKIYRDVLSDGINIFADIQMIPVMQGACAAMRLSNPG